MKMFVESAVSSKSRARGLQGSLESESCFHGRPTSENNEAY